MTKPDALLSRKADPHVGHETLDRIAGMDRANRWMFDVLSPHIGQRVLEAGAGRGNLTRFLLDREDLVCLDFDSAHVGTLEDNDESILPAVVGGGAPVPVSGETPYSTLCSLPARAFAGCGTCWNTQAFRR